MEISSIETHVVLLCIMRPNVYRYLRNKMICHFVKFLHLYLRKVIVAIYFSKGLTFVKTGLSNATFCTGQHMSRDR